MPQMNATFMVHGDNGECEEMRKFVEAAGIRLNIRDIKEQPLGVRELESLFGHNPLTYFINPSSPEFSALDLEDKNPTREEMLQLLSEHPGLLRVPIIKSTRLLTVGCNKDRISEMLQINRNGDGVDEPANNRSPRITRRALPSRK